jgi:LysR family glycine cleavage system transcriptional activator
MSRRLPSLNALKCFEVVATHLSIRKAAVALHISESAVSRQVRILEQQLGIGLFHRKPNGLEITDSGKALYENTKIAFDRIANTVDEFKCDRDTVELKVLPTFAMRWLYPRLRKFRDQNPLIRIVVHTRWHDMNPGDGDAHLGIRYGLGNWPEAKELYKEWLIPVCAPDYLSGRKFETAADFDKVTLLHPLPDKADWSLWADRWGGERFDTNRGLDFDGLDMALSAAATGFGVAITDVVLAHDMIETGELIIPFRKPVPSDQSYYLVRAPEFADRRQVNLVHDWICNEVNESQRIIESYME